MTTLSIQFKGMQEKILEKITEIGLAETKSEAVRMAVLKFAIDLKLIDQPMLVKSLQEELGTDKVSAEQALREIGRVKNESIHR